MDLRLVGTEVPGATVVAVDGELDAVSAPQLDEFLTPLVAEGGRVVLDLSGVEFLDSTGLGVVIKSLAAARDAGGELTAVVTSPRVSKVFTITGVDQMMVLRDSVDAALAGE